MRSSSVGEEALVRSRGRARSTTFGVDTSSGLGDGWRLVVLNGEHSNLSWGGVSTRISGSECNVGIDEASSRWGTRRSVIASNSDLRRGSAVIHNGSYCGTVNPSEEFRVGIRVTRNSQLRLTKSQGWWSRIVDRVRSSGTNLTTARVSRSESHWARRARARLSGVEVIRPSDTRARISGNRSSVREQPRLKLVRARWIRAVDGQSRSRGSQHRRNGIGDGESGGGGSDSSTSIGDGEGHWARVGVTTIWCASYKVVGPDQTVRSLAGISGLRSTMGGQPIVERGVVSSGTFSSLVASRGGDRWRGGILDGKRSGGDCNVVTRVRGDEGEWFGTNMSESLANRQSC